MQVNSVINLGASVLGSISLSRTTSVGDDDAKEPTWYHSDYLAPQKSVGDESWCHNDNLAPAQKYVDDVHIKEAWYHNDNLAPTQSRDDDVNPQYNEEEERSQENGEDGYDWRDVTKQLRANPSLARVGTEGVLPLHAACGAGAPLRVIEMLLNIYPEAVQIKCDKGYTPIFYHLTLMKESPSEEIVSALIEAYPESATVVDNNNRLPIHYACKATGVSANIFTTLLRAYPKAAYVCDDEGNYPVDYAAANKDTATRKVALAALIENDPEEIRGNVPEEEKSSQGVNTSTGEVDSLLNEPNREHESTSLTDELIHDILTTFTNSAEMEEGPYLMRATISELRESFHYVDEKCLVVHLEQCLELGSPPSQAITTTLIDSYPTSARVFNTKKQLPIHLACQATGVRQQSFFTLLLQAYPGAAYICDDDGKCPIDYAIANNDITTRKNAIGALVQNDDYRVQAEASSPAVTAEHSPPIMHEAYVPEISTAPAIASEETYTAAEKSLLQHLEHCLKHDLLPSEAIVRKIVDEYPISACVANANKQLPIHLACKSAGVSNEILILLLHAYPEGAYVCDMNGMYPVDYAASNRDMATRKRAMATLVHNDSHVRPSSQTQPATSGYVEDDGPVVACGCGHTKNTEENKFDANDHLLEILASTSPQEDIVLSVIESYPGAVRVLDADGRLPIHHACMGKGVADFIFLYILGAYPEGAYFPDRFGKYPIDYAAANEDEKTRTSAIEALMRNDVTKGMAKGASA